MITTREQRADQVQPGQALQHGKTLKWITRTEVHATGVSLHWATGWVFYGAAETVRVLA